MTKEGRFWPTEQDLTPKTARFWVPRSSLLCTDEDYYLGVSQVIVTETPEDVDDRLKEQFPLYRVKRWGQEIIERVGGVNEV